MLAGIRDILIITTPARPGPVRRGCSATARRSGSNLTYAVQPEPERAGPGVHHRRRARRRRHRPRWCWATTSSTATGSASSSPSAADARRAAARCSATRCAIPQRYGVAEADADGRLISIEEKPAAAQVEPGRDRAVLLRQRRRRDRRAGCGRRARGELEITDLNNVYVGARHGPARSTSAAAPPGSTPAPTTRCSRPASSCRCIEHRQGVRIACLEEIALRQGFIDAEQAYRLGEAQAKSGYGAVRHGPARRRVDRGDSTSAVSAGSAGRSAAICSSRAMRWAIGGWVENRLPMPPAAERVGDHQVAGGDQARVLRQRRGRRARLSLRSALARASGSLDSSAPDSSAWYSRERLIASWISPAASGPRISISSSASGLRSRSLPAAAEEERELGDVGDRGRERAGHRGDQDVAVVDVAELVPEHGPQLALVEDLQDALGGADRRVARVAAGREGVGLRRSARRRAAASAGGRWWPARARSRYIAGCSASLTGRARIDAQRDLVGVEVAERVDAQREDQADDQAGRAADRRR